MNFNYIIERKTLENLPLKENISVNPIEGLNAFYRELIEVFSDEKLELETKDQYTKLIFISIDKKLRKNLLELTSKYIQKITGLEDLQCIMEYDNDICYNLWYSHNLPVYVNLNDMEKILVKINTFTNDHYFYTDKENDLKKLNKNRSSLLNEQGVFYSLKPMPWVEKSFLMDKIHASEKNINDYINLPSLGENTFRYRDMEEIKNIARIENNLLPRHDLLKNNKFKLLEVLNKDNIPWDYEEINDHLANNVLSFSNRTDLQEKVKDIYESKDIFKSTYYKDKNDALCAFLNSRMAEQDVLLIEEKDQFVLYHKDDLVSNDIKQCRNNIFKLMGKQDNGQNLESLLNCYFFGEIDQEKPYFFDNKNNPLPLHIVHNQDKLFYCYHRNGLFKSLLDDKLHDNIHKLNVNIIMENIDQNRYILSVEYKNKKHVLSNNFYCPSEKKKLCQEKLKNLFNTGLFLTPFGNDYLKKYDSILEKEIRKPKWFYNLNKSKEQELIKYISGI